MCEIYSDLSTKTPERRQRYYSSVFIFNVEQLSHIILVFSIVDFEQFNADWESLNPLTSRFTIIPKT